MRALTPATAAPPILPPPPPRGVLTEVRVPDSMLSLRTSAPKEEPRTGKTNQELALYQRIIAWFDGENNPQGTDMIELIEMFSAASLDDRNTLLGVTRKIVRP